MNPTLARALVIAVPIGALLVSASLSLARTRTLYAACWFIGAVCLGIVVLTHVAESMGWFPAMRWGQPDSAGHYLDLTSACVGATLVIVGTITRLTRRI